MSGLIKKIAIALVVIVVIAGVAGAGGKKDKSTDTASATSEASQTESTESVEEAEPAEDEAPDSKYGVTINEATVGTDYSDEPCIFITYTFTNISDEDPTSFATALHAEVYQNGVQCETAFADTDGGGDYMTKVKAGNSVDVTMAYELQDTTSDVEVEVSELFSFDKTKLATKTFSIA